MKTDALVLRFLFSGYKRNDLTDLTISKEISELRLVIDFLETKNINKQKIGIISQSLGCVVSMLLNDPRIRVMAMLAPLINLKEAFSKQFGKNKIRELEIFGHTTIVRRGQQRRKLGVDFWSEVKK